MRRQLSVVCCAAGSLLIASGAMADVFDVQRIEPSALEPPPVITEGRTYLTTHNGTTFTAIDLNALLGATRFYNAGYAGTQARQASIEAGHIYNLHDALLHHSVRFSGTGSVNTSTVTDHNTMVGHAMGGRDAATPAFPLANNGIAPMAELWSGAIATSLGGGGTFNYSFGSLASTYSAIVKNGFAASGGEVADVFNSSWGFFASSPPASRNPITAGNNAQTIGIDGLINLTGVVAVFAAGNDGASGSNTVGGPGAGYNSITVGALGTDTSNPLYNTRSSFSSFGPNTFLLTTSPTNATGTYISAASSQRAVVDISAPGEQLALAANGFPDSYFVGSAGTSFAAPMVAGGASLIVDAGRQLYGTSAARDGRVVKAVLLNGADKTGGWTNNQTNISGVITTTQSLDYQVGAGRMNLDRTFDNFVSTAAGGMAGTTDVAGLTSGDLGNVAPLGWDFGQVQFAGGTNRYFIDSVLEGSSLFTATLTWFADRFHGTDADFTGWQEQHLANLNLRIFSFDDLTERTITGYLGESISLYNVVEHLNFTLPADGFYGVEVAYAGSHWNFTSQTTELYGLAWSSTAIPEPAAFALLGLAGLFLLRRRTAG